MSGMEAEKPRGVPMKAIPLFELSWREYATGEGGTYGVTCSQTHQIRIEREAALSLFSALEAAGQFYDVKIEKSKWSSYVPSEGAFVPEDSGSEATTARRDAPGDAAPLTGVVDTDASHSPVVSGQEEPK